MHTFQLLLAGFAEVFKPLDMLMMFIGLLIGMAVSIMPGLGLVMGVVLALPFTYGLALEPSIILLTAIYMSGTYAGCFTAILYRIPGEPMDVPLLWDGYAMTQRGEAAKALGWALVAALTGGLVSTAVMTTLATPLSEFALKFGAPEYFAAVFFGLTTVVALAGTSIPNALISMFLGLLVATIGTDGTYGTERFTFNSPILTNGVPYVMVLVGMYGFGEILIKLGQSLHVEVPPDRASTKTRFPSFAELWQLRMTFVRSTFLGTILGVVPGAGATITSFVSYAIEKQYGRRGDKIGTGIPEGIVAPQIASTASVAGHLVPLLTLGIPGSGATAVILAAFLLHGVQPGPFLFENPKSTLVVYTIMASMFVAVIGMCLMGFAWIHVVVKVLTIPQGVLAAIVIMFCLIGAFADRNTISDMWMIVIFGTLAALFERYRFPVSPMVLGAILGPLAEDSYMRSMITYHRDWTVFFTQPIAGGLMALSIVSLSYPIVRSLIARRRATVAAAVQYPRSLEQVENIMRLRTKVAVVTGGASGIGKAIAAAYVREGAKVVIVDIDERKGNDAAAEIGAKGDAICIRADVTDSTSVNQMASEADRRFGRIDILVNNVGVRTTKPFLEHTDADWNIMIATNLTGPFFCARAVTPFMIRGGRGRIINTASIASFVGRPNRVAYVSAKSGVLGMTRALAIDLGPSGITVNTMVPGSINSPMNASQAADAAHDWGKETPVGRWGTPEDIANAAVFLALDESSYITGTDVTVDGGWVSTKARAGELA